MLDELDFSVIWDNFHFLLEGMGLTLWLTLLAIGGGIIFGTILALCRLSHIRLLSFVAGSYVNFLRSMPLILVIFWLYFLVPLVIGRPVGTFYSVLVAFVMFEAAYYCEIIRAGIQSVKKGQIFAGQALGMTYKQNMQYIVLPQAFRNMIPILVTQAIILFQDTALVYVVGLADFLVVGERIATIENRTIEVFLFIAFVYFVMCLVGTILVGKLQRKYAL
jgi:glutamate/aspartate transport system permease protein